MALVRWHFSLSDKSPGFGIRAEAGWAISTTENTSWIRNTATAIGSQFSIELSTSLFRKSQPNFVIINLSLYGGS